MEDQQQLRVYLKFDDADLQANRQGQITEKQMARLAANDKSNRTLTMIGGIGLILIALVGLGSAVAGWSGSADWGFGIGFGFGFGCVWPLIWGGLGYGLLSSSLSKHKFKLARVQGHAKFVRMESHNSDSHTTSVQHELHIGGQRFKVPSLLADVIMPGDEYQYTLYYVDNPDNKESIALVKSYESILSAEALLKAPGLPVAAKVPANKASGNLVVLDAGLKKIATIKVIRQLTGLGLVEAKMIADTPHSVVLRDVTETSAREAILLFEKAGAVVRIE